MASVTRGDSGVEGGRTVGVGVGGGKTEQKVQLHFIAPCATKLLFTNPNWELDVFLYYLGMRQISGQMIRFIPIWYPAQYRI